MEKGKRRSLKGWGGGGQGVFFCKFLEAPRVPLPQTIPQFLPITRAEDRMEEHLPSAGLWSWVPPGHTW